jgi:hypothetical protein
MGREREEEGAPGEGKVTEDPVPKVSTTHGLHCLLLSVSLCACMRVCVCTLTAHKWELSSVGREVI